MPYPIVNKAIAYNEELIRKNEEMAKKISSSGIGNSYLERAEAFNKEQIKRAERRIGVEETWGKDILARMGAFTIQPKKKVEKVYAETRVESREPEETYIANAPEGIREREQALQEEYSEPAEEKAEPKQMPKTAKPFRLPLVAQEDILKGVAEKGAWYPVKQTAFNKYSYNELKNKGYIQEDNFGRASITDKGEAYLGTWGIKYEPKLAPVFEAPKYEAEEKIIQEAEGEFPAEKLPTAEELVGGAYVEKKIPKVEIIRAEPSKFKEAVEREKAYLVDLAEKEKKAIKKVQEVERKVIESAKGAGRGIQKGYRAVAGLFRRKE